MIITHVQISKLLFIPAGANPQNISLDPNPTGLHLPRNSWWCPEFSVKLGLHGARCCRSMQERGCFCPTSMTTCNMWGKKEGREREERGR